MGTTPKPLFGRNSKQQMAHYIGIEHVLPGKAVASPSVDTSRALRSRVDFRGAVLHGFMLRICIDSDQSCISVPYPEERTDE